MYFLHGYTGASHAGLLGYASAMNDEGARASRKVGLLYPPGYTRSQNDVRDDRRASSIHDCVRIVRSARKVDETPITVMQANKLGWHRNRRFFFRADSIRDKII
ncbi:hypothetical protein P5V15_004579 [Pogonomyrmex californicus]